MHDRCTQRGSEGTKKPANPDGLTGLSNLALERSGSGVIVALCPLFLGLPLVMRDGLMVISGDLRADFNGVKTFRSLDDFEIYRLSGLQGFITFHGDRGKMSEEVFVLSVLDDKTVTLGIVEPFDLAADLDA